MSVPRLSLSTLDRLDPGVRRPVDPREVAVGIVHLGIGAFHRAHQAVFTEDAMSLSGDTRWGICGVTQRSARVAEQLAPQDGLYGVLQMGVDHADRPDVSMRVVGAVREVAFPGTDTEHVLERLAAPTTHVVTLTVTEKGYYRDAGGLDLAHPNVRADLAALAAELRGDGAPPPARTPLGMLTRGLARRYRREPAPLTVVPCDNVGDNGTMVAGLVRDLMGALPAGLGEGLSEWVAQHVAFPSTMVDRIVPATHAEHHAQAERISGLADAGLVVGEPFSQWVVEDRFAGPRPRWELAGATFTDDVAPYEQAKLRMLNGPHSYLAYRGAVRGYGSIAAAVRDPGLQAEVRALMDDDVAPTLRPPAELDLSRYRDSILERFANPHTGHTTVQVAMDGSQKLPVRLLGTAAERLATGQVPQGCARAVAAWIVFVAHTLDGALPLDDPLADRLRAAAAGDRTGLADRMLALADVFPAAVAEHDGFRRAVRDHVADLTGEAGDWSRRRTDASEAAD